MAREFGPIECRYVRLRSFTETDLPTFAQYRSEPDVARYQSWTTYSLADAEALYADMAGKAFGLIGEWYQIAIADRHTDRLLGDLAVHFLDAGQVEVGFTVAPAHQGKGYAREALDALLAYLFGELGCERVIAITDTRNRAAARLLDACGFICRPVTRTVSFKGAIAEEYVFECHQPRDA